MWPSDKFGVAVWTDTARQPVRLSGQSAAAVRALLGAAGPIVLEVHADSANVSLAEFLLWRNADGLVCLRIDEHREHYGIDPVRSAERDELWFPDGQGGSFPVQAAEAVEWWQATEALGHWLQDGRKWPGLIWS